MKKIILTLIITLIAASVPVLAAASYYVDAAGGSDSNDGLSPATAWKTISKVNRSSFNPGDKIFFKRNLEWREQLTIPSSGAYGSPITFSAYGNGDAPVINGADLLSGWTQYNSTVWQVNFSSNPNVVFFDGRKGNKKNSISNLNSENDWYWNSNILFVYSSSNPNTYYKNPGIEAGARNLCIRLSNNDFIIIDGLHVTKSNMDGISEYSSSNRTTVTIKNCECSYHHRIGIRYSVRGSATVNNLSINNNESHHNNYDSGNDIFTSGIYISGGPKTVIDPQVFNNYTHHNLGDGIRVSGCLNGDVYGNISIHDGHSKTYTSSAWMIGGASKDVLFYQNYAFDPGGEGMFIGQSSSTEGGHEFFYNIIDSPGDAGITIARYDDNCKIYNNTFYNCVAYAVRLGSATRITGTVIKNNLADKQRDYNVSLENSSTAVIDNNCWDENYGFSINRSYLSLSQWQARGYDINCLYQDANLTNPTDYDFSLRSNSPCIDAGVDVGLSQDYYDVSVPQGYYPDIGACEYTANNPLTASIDASENSGWAPLSVGFTGTASGGTSPYSYAWNFGDGQTSTEKNPEHSFSNAGSYTVTLKVTDNTNNQDSDSIIINVYDSEAILSITNATGSPSPGQGGTTDPKSGNHSYDSGSSVQVTAVPYSDYRFSLWSGNIADSIRYSREITITLDADKSITAYFCTKAGDVNGDLRISPADAQTAFDIYLGKISNPTHCQKENGDVNCDGTKSAPLISPADAQAIFERYLGLSNLPCDCTGQSRAATSAGGGMSQYNSITPDINLLIDEIEKLPGGKIAVPIVIDNPYSLDSFGFDLFFPSESLEFLGTAQGHLLDNFDQVDSFLIHDGILRIGGYSITPVQHQASGDLVTLIFKVKTDESAVQNLFIANGVDDLKEVNFHSGRMKKDLIMRGKINK
jgi:PKD repeat protein